MAAVARALGHAFRDPALLRDALTHRSFANERPDLAPCDNERLEFLGDAVLGLAVAAMLFATYPKAREGELTRRRADLICEGALCEVAQGIGLGAALRLGNGEEQTGGRAKPRLLASALEACLGAVYEDAGVEAAFAVVRRLLGDRLAAARGGGAADFKSRAQQLAQRFAGETPTYALLRTEGPEHDLRFHVEIRLGGRALAEGEGRSKADAEQAAAKNALPLLAAPPDAG